MKHETEIRAAGDVCAYCPSKATTQLTVHKKGAKKLPYKVPVCAPCKQRIEDNIVRDGGKVL